jgi:hypothetical protein
MSGSSTPMSRNRDEVHCRQRRIDLTCFYTHDVKTFCRQSKDQMLAQSARFKADPFNRMGNFPRHSVMSLTSHGSSRSSSTVPLPSTMQSAQDRSYTSIPAKYSISHLPCSQSPCDLIGSSTSEQRAAQLRMLWADKQQMLRHAHFYMKGGKCRTTPFRIFGRFE